MNFNLNILNCVLKLVLFPVQKSFVLATMNTGILKGLIKVSVPTKSSFLPVDSYLNLLAYNSKVENYYIPISLKENI